MTTNEMLDEIFENLKEEECRFLTLPQKAIVPLNNLHFQGGAQKVNVHAKQN